ncbi:hypothetical protein CROQUDRAFT_136603 [Cronartium quercuum f. sp. fusiforme G11]|uniref:Uncharacterized protein n=1 Tax=Cronartium quercuum f. sp. fusiforme G11 TaxID=708437 RepID=A0A9P6N6J8_9BASI|nr:hypothetical protein CROQUDRAFT_136603 [Cronartium quercuum f. sp. fusiforme G11]
MFSPTMPNSPRLECAETLLILRCMDDYTESLILASTLSLVTNIGPSSLLLKKTPSHSSSVSTSYEDHSNYRTPSSKRACESDSAEGALLTQKKKPKKIRAQQASHYQLKENVSHSPIKIIKSGSVKLKKSPKKSTHTKASEMNVLVSDSKAPGPIRIRLSMGCRQKYCPESFGCTLSLSDRA